VSVAGSRSGAWASSAVPSAKRGLGAETKVPYGGDGESHDVPDIAEAEVTGHDGLGPPESGGQRGYLFARNCPCSWG
jgi:hypothetical protein